MQLSKFVMLFFIAHQIKKLFLSFVTRSIYYIKHNEKNSWHKIVSNNKLFMDENSKFCLKNVYRHTRV